jgi:predicted porin
MKYASSSTINRAVSVRARAGSAGPVLAGLVGALAILAASPTVAGVPFLTDDPGTPEKGGWEINLSAQYSHAKEGREGLLPSLEINYGLLENLQVTIAPSMALSHEFGTSANYGFGDLVLGAKYRIIEDDEMGWRPAVAFAPSISLPTGDADRGLGAGRATYSLPLWLSKDFDRWSVATGASYNINPGLGNKDFWFAGVLLTYALSETLTVGGEIYHRTKEEVDGKSSTGFNLGFLYDFSENHHLLFSAGRNFTNADENNQFSTYVGYRLTF